MDHRTGNLALGALLLLVVGAAACGSDPLAPGGNPNGDLDVEFRNFSTQAASMAQVGQPAITVVGNATDGTPRLYSVVNPGEGNTLDFTADWNGSTLTVSCTVTANTNVSVPPGVVIQPFGFLDCIDW